MLRSFAISLTVLSSVSAWAGTACPQHFAGGVPPIIVNAKLQPHTQEVCFEAFAVLHSGLVLGRDLSVIVYDGLGSDSVVRTSVTAVMQPTPSTTGVALAEMTLARLRGEPLESLQKLCMPELEIGDSDGPPLAS